MTVTAGPGGLRHEINAWYLWSLAVGLVISGEYFGWNYGWGAAGTVGFLVTTLIVAVLYVAFIFSFTELTTAIPHAGGPFAYALAAFGPAGGLIAGYATLIEFVFAPPAIAASVARHSRVLTLNKFHNGHPDLIPQGRYANDAVAAGEDGIEIKATKGGPAVDTHGARDAWFCVFRYKVDTTEPIAESPPTRFIEVLLAQLSREDFRRNPRGELGTRTASPNRVGVAKLRASWIYRD